MEWPEDYTADLVSDGSVIMTRANDLVRARVQCNNRRRFWVFRHPYPLPFSNSGFGFRNRARYVVRGRVFKSSSRP